MKLTKLLERLDYKVVAGSDNIEITELVNDSRKVVPGSVFVCISGAVSDGHQYVKDVAERGAAAVIVEKDVEVPEGLTVIKVENLVFSTLITVNPSGTSTSFSTITAAAPLSATSFTY